MSQFIVQCLNPYRKPDCKLGRISNTDDFKHLARKVRPERVGARWPWSSALSPQTLNRVSNAGRLQFSLRSGRMCKQSFIGVCVNFYDPLLLFRLANPRGKKKKPQWKAFLIQNGPFLAPSHPPPPRPVGVGDTQTYQDFEAVRRQ